MKIKDLETNDLKLKCLDLITKTFVELGQVKDDKTLAILAQTLCNDLLEDFSTLTFIQYHWISIGSVHIVLGFHFFPF